MANLTEAETVEYLMSEPVNMSAGRASDSIAAMKDGAVIHPVENSTDENMRFSKQDGAFLRQRK
jgi:hypothetical protein